MRPIPRLDSLNFSHADSPILYYYHITSNYTIPIPCFTFYWSSSSLLIYFFFNERKLVIYDLEGLFENHKPNRTVFFLLFLFLNYCRFAFGFCTLSLSSTFFNLNSVIVDII